MRQVLPKGTLLPAADGDVPQKTSELTEDLEVEVVRVGDTFRVTNTRNVLVGWGESPALAIDDLLYEMARARRYERMDVRDE